MHENRIRFAPMAGPLLVALLLGACGSDDKSSEFVVPPAADTPAIIAFGAEPKAIEAGEPVTLAWKTRNVVELALVDGFGTAVSLDGASVEQGEVVVRPAATTSYTLTAIGPEAGTPTTSRTSIVTVREAATMPPAVVEFAATPAEVAIGVSVTLSWRTEGATRVAIKDDAGHAVELGDAGAAAGQVTVEPVRSPTVYILTADGPGGRDSAEVSVAVTGLPRVVRFDVSPSTAIDVGDSVTLSWATANAASVVIEQDGRPLDISPTELTSSRTIALTESAVFTLVAKSTAGSAEARVEARVGPRIVAFSSTERKVRKGDRVTLTWQLADATRATIEGPGGDVRSIEDSSLSSGSAAWDVTQGGLFVLRAFRGEVSRTAAIAIDVTGAPRIRSLTVDPPRVTAIFDSPQRVTLAWSQDGADTCTVYRANVPVPGLDGFPCAATGTAEVPVFNTGTLRLEARNTDGVDAASVGVEAVQRAVVDFFAATPNRRLTPGSPVELSWSVFGGVSVSMKRGELPFTVDPSAMTGNAADFVDEDTIYTLTALNSLGYPTEALLQVRAGAPEILSAFVEPSFVAIGDQLVVRWTADGGDLLTITRVGQTEPDFSTREGNRIDDGSAPLVAPTDVGLHVYTVRVENDLGVFSERTLEITASDGPIIGSFTVDRTGVSRDEYVTLTWKVQNDREGVRPSLSLTDSRGNNYASQLAALDPNGASLPIQLKEEGAYRFTLTAKTEGRGEHARYLDVEVTTAPTISQFEAKPDRFDTEEGTLEPVSELHWKTKDGVELEIFEVDAEGQPTGAALLWITALGGDQARIDEGTLAVYPTTTTRYLARVRNRVGSEVERRALVVLDPPEMLTLLAEPTDIIIGETTRLHWTSRRATEVRVSPSPAGVGRLGNTYVDISAIGTPIEISGDHALATIDFPEGFVFPFGGEDRTAIQVCANGWAGFNPTNTVGGTFSPGAFPTGDHTRYMNFALYVARLDLGKIIYGMHTDAIGDSFIVQWHGMTWNSSTYNPSNLNFQLVLRPDGRFEYRYGPMTALGDGRADGVGAAIGFQLPDSGSTGMNVVAYQTAVPGGLANTGFALQPDLPPNGSMDVMPVADTTYTVTAASPHATHDMTASVKVWKVPEVSVDSDPLDPLAGEPFKIAWTTSNATSVRLLDENGEELCAFDDVTRVAKGSWTLVETDPGLKRYTLEVINGLERNAVTRKLDVMVFGSLSIDKFEVTPGQFVTDGTKVTLEWAASGADEVWLSACTPDTNLADCIGVTPRDAKPEGGTYTYTAAASRSVEYLLEVYRDGRGISRTLEVWVDAGTLDKFKATKRQILSGESTTLEWTSTDQRRATLEPYEPKFIDVTASAPFIDISGTGVLAGLTGDSANEVINFPAGFTFPFEGVNRTAIQVNTNGRAGFSLDPSNNTTLVAVNTMGGTNSWRFVNFALYTANLHSDTNTAKGQLFYGMHTDELGDCFIIQWKNWGWNATYNPSNLNFELVLRPTGAFEYRYGAMTASTDNRASGEGAYIGFQYPSTGSYGAMLVEGLKVVPGGLRNRSWRVEAGFRPNGSVVVSPTESTTYTLCATNASLHWDCKTTRVVVVKAGDVLFSELMFAPPDAPNAQWIELRNMSPDWLDLGGWTLLTGSGLHTLPSLVVEPEAYAVLARSDVPLLNGGLSPISHVCGDELALNATAGSVVLTNDTLEVDRVTWTGAWNNPTQNSIAVNPSLMTRTPSCNDAASAWCETTIPYGGGTYGGSPGEAGPGCGK